MKVTFKTIFIFLLLLSLADLSSQNEVIDLQISSYRVQNMDKVVGPNGTFGLFTNRESLSMLGSDIEEKTRFNGPIYHYDEKYTYEWDCRLWDSEKMNVTVFCRVKDELYNKSINNYILNPINITVGNYTLRLQSITFFTLKMKHYNMPFVYGDYQIIDLDKDQAQYAIYFKVDSYQGEKLVITEPISNNSFAEFDSCDVNGTEFTCYISRKKVEGLSTQNTLLTIAQLDEKNGIKYFEYPLQIQVKYTQPKEEVYLIITKALNEISEPRSYSAFETNITDISPLTTNTFRLEVYSESYFSNITCFFRKYEAEKIPLLLLCENIFSDYYFYINNNLTFTDINYKYNFNIKKSDMIVKMQIDNVGKKIIYNYPETLDFTNSEKLSIIYLMTGASYFNNIKLAEGGDNLECQNYNFSKVCTID